jgi:hypothetical protein
MNVHAWLGLCHFRPHLQLQPPLASTNPFDGVGTRPTPFAVWDIYSDLADGDGDH